MVRVYLQCSGHVVRVGMAFPISERLARKRVILTLGLVKRSGRPEQWSKLGEKYDLIRRNRPFLGHLERFGENWIGIWINC